MVAAMAPADISLNYTPFGHSDWQTRVAAIKRFGRIDSHLSDLAHCRGKDRRLLPVAEPRGSADSDPGPAH